MRKRKRKRKREKFHTTIGDLLLAVVVVFSLDYKVRAELDVGHVVFTADWASDSWPVVTLLGPFCIDISAHLEEREAVGEVVQFFLDLSPFFLSLGLLQRSSAFSGFFSGSFSPSWLPPTFFFRPRRWLSPATFAVGPVAAVHPGALVLRTLLALPGLPVVPP